MSKITLAEMCESRVKDLVKLFDTQDLAFYVHNVKANGLSVDDSIGYLHRRAWNDVQHNREPYDIFAYFKEYVERFGGKLNE